MSKKRKERKKKGLRVKKMRIEGEIKIEEVEKMKKEELRGAHVSLLLRRFHQLVVRAQV